MLLRGIDPEVGLGAVDAGVSQPQRYLSNVAGHFQDVQGTRVSQGVHRHTLSAQRRLMSASGLKMHCHAVAESLSGHCAGLGIQEKMRIRAVGTNYEPLSHQQSGLFP